MGNDPEKLSNSRRQTQRTVIETRKEGLKKYADMTIYTIQLL